MVIIFNSPEIFEMDAATNERDSWITHQGLDIADE